MSVTVTRCKRAHKERETSRISIFGIEGRVYWQTYSSLVLFLGNTSVCYGTGRMLDLKKFQGTAVDVGVFFSII